VPADALFCPACREPMATSLFSLDAVAPAPPAAPVADGVDRRAAAAPAPSSPASSGLELALPSRCRVCGAPLSDEAMQRRGTCVLHAHRTGEHARPMTATSAAPSADDGEDEKPPGTGPLGSLVGLLVVVAIGAGGWWWLQGDTDAPVVGDVAVVADVADVADGTSGGGPAGRTKTGGISPAEASGRVDELLGGGAAGRIGAASSRPPSSPSTLAANGNDDEVSAEVEQLIAQSGHPTAPDLGEYEAILDGTADGAPGPTARGWAAMGQLNDDDARATARTKLDALAARLPSDPTVAAARAEIHVDDDPDGALVAAAKTNNVDDAARLRGKAFAVQGDVDGAVAALSATADRDPRATRALVALQAPRGRCADVEAASAKLAATRGGQAVVDHVRLLAACRPNLDAAVALEGAVVRLPATSDAERAALRATLAEAALSRGANDVADRACADLGTGAAASPDVARARRRCLLVRPGADAALDAVVSSKPTSTALLRAFGVNDARTAPWGRAGAQLRFLGALHDGAAVSAALVDVVQALWSPSSSLSRVPPFGPRELDALVAALVPAPRRAVALAVTRGLGGDVDGGVGLLAAVRDVDAASARAALLVAAGRLADARAALPPALSGNVVGRAVTALSSSSPVALRALLTDPNVGPRAYRALVERGATTAADAAVARRYALHPDVVAANGR
jgi:hypothetical protein